jgi:hypothetical protein
MPRPEHRRKRANRVFVWFERGVLGVGMSIIVSFIERRLLKAIKKGGVEPAPRTAAAIEGAAPPVEAGVQDHVELSTPPR